LYEEYAEIVEAYEKLVKALRERNHLEAARLAGKLTELLDKFERARERVLGRT